MSVIVSYRSADLIARSADAAQHSHSGLRQGRHCRMQIERASHPLVFILARYQLGGGARKYSVRNAADRFKAFRFWLVAHVGNQIRKGIENVRKGVGEIQHVQR